MKTFSVFQALQVSIQTFRDTFSGPSSYLPSLRTEQSLGLMRFDKQAISSNILTPRMQCISQETISGLHTASFHFSREILQALESVYEIPLWTLFTVQPNTGWSFLGCSSLTPQGNISDLLFSTSVAELPLLSPGGIQSLHSPISWYWFINDLSCLLLWIFVLVFSCPCAKNNLLVQKDGI